MLFLRIFFYVRQYNLHYLCCQVDLFAYVIFCVNVRLYSRMGLEQVSGAQEFSGNFKETLRDPLHQLTRLQLQTVCGSGDTKKINFNHMW